MARKRPGTMQMFGGGCRAGRLRELIRQYAAEHGLSLEDAAKGYVEEMARARGEQVGNLTHTRVYVLGQWPKKNR
jgi:hypothetical protein